MVICQECQQALPAGRLDKRFCSGTCRMRYHRRQKDAQQPARVWRQTMSFLQPTYFAKSDEYPVPTLDQGRCWVPRALWHPDLEALNALWYIRLTLTEFDELAGSEFMADEPEDGDWLGHSVGAGMMTWVEAVDKELQALSQSRGRLAQLLRDHWAELEQGQRTLRRHVQRFLLSQPLQQSFVVEYSADMAAHLQAWNLELGLLWLDLEAQTR